MTIETLALQGHSAIRGSMASSILPRIGEIRNEAIKDCFRDFQCIEHRLEPVANIHGIEFINDSRATNINSTWYALESMIRPVIWIAGGAGIRHDYSILADVVAQKVKAIIFLGSRDERLASLIRYLELPITEAASMSDAVDLAYLIGKKGDVVLMSPGCASFGFFPDFEERGKAFRKAVKDL